MLSDHERNQAIKEGARNAADAAYFNGRPHLADDTAIRVFDAGFDRGWDAATDPLLAEIERLTRELEEARKVLKETGLLLHHFWCDVQMNDYSFDKLNKGIGAIDAAVKEQT